MIDIEKFKFKNIKIENIRDGEYIKIYFEIKGNQAGYFIEINYFESKWEIGNYVWHEPETFRHCQICKKEVFGCLTLNSYAKQIAKKLINHPKIRLRWLMYKNQINSKKIKLKQ